MHTKIKNTYLLAAVLLVACSSMFCVPKSASAETIEYSAAITYDDAGGCPILINGIPRGGESLHVPRGDYINLTVTSTSSRLDGAVSVWLKADYEAAPYGYGYSPLFNLDHPAPGLRTGTIDDLQDDLVVVVGYSSGEDCVGGQYRVVNIYVDDPAPAESAAPAPAPKPRKTTAANTPAPAPVEEKAPPTVQLSTVTAAGQTVDLTKPSFEIEQSQPLVLSGKSVPNSTVNLTIHSTPRTATVKTDGDGNWSYTVTDLEPGDHYVEASVVDPATNQTTAPTKILTFKVNPKQAATVAAPATSAKPNKAKPLGITAIALCVIAAAVAAGVRYRAAISRRLKNFSQYQALRRSLGKVLPARLRKPKA